MLKIRHFAKLQTVIGYSKRHPANKKSPTNENYFVPLIVYENIMTKKFHILLIILTIGFFATPMITYACGTKTTKTEKSCCKKSKNEKDNKKDCCEKGNSKRDNDDKGCDGKCNNSNCSCPTTHFAFSMPFWTKIRAKTYFAESKKTKNYYNESYPSDGFVCIWTPPNIG